MRKNNRFDGKSGFLNARTIVGLVLIVVAIALVGILIPKLKTGSTVYSFISVRTDIPAGTMITQDNLQDLFIEKNTSDNGIYLLYVPVSKATTLYGKYVLRDMSAGQPLTAADIGEQYGKELVEVPDDKLLVAASVHSLQGDIAYLPQAGDIVRVYKSAANVNAEQRLDDTAGVEVYDLLQYVQIHSVRDANGLNVEKSGDKPAVIVFIASDEQAKQIILAEENSHFYMSLVCSGSDPKAEAYLKAQETYAERKKEDGEPVSVPLSALILDEGYFYDPKCLDNTYVSFGCEKTREQKKISESGKLETVQVTEYAESDLLCCVKVDAIYNSKGISFATGALDPAQFEYDYEHCSLGLILSQMQAEELSEMLNAGKVHVRILEEGGSGLPDDYAERTERQLSATMKSLIK